MKKLLFIFSFILIKITLFAQSLNIVDLGAIGDGKTDNTEIIQKAIDRCSPLKWAVVIPKGIFLTRSLFLKSGVNLRLDEEAILLGSTNLESYCSPFHKNTVSKTPALIFSEFTNDISITGKGIIDGQGDHKNFDLGKDVGGRPMILRFGECTNVRIEGITLRNSAYWAQYYSCCTGVIIKNIKVYNHSNWNNDGLDIDSKNVEISDCYIDSDDDALCFKSDNRRFCENITVKNCTLRSNCNAIKCGTSSTGGFKNITVTNCKVENASEDNFQQFYKRYPWIGVKENSVIAGIALESVDGGIMEQITVSDIDMKGVQTPIFIRLDDRKRTFSKKISILKNITINNINAEVVSLLASSITGIPNNYIENITLSNISVKSIGGIILKSDYTEIVPENIGHYPENRMFGTILPASGFYIRHGKNIKLNNIQLSTTNQDIRPMFYLDDVKNIRIDNSKKNGGIADTKRK